MKHYYVYTDKTSIETCALSKIKPAALLLSYYYFRNKPLHTVVEKLGYHPEILLDSGAYSAFTKGTNISPIDYMNYISANKDFITDYISLDVIGDAELSKMYFEILSLKGFSPIPVYHHGDDIKYLNWYISQGCNFIALGGTVPISDKSVVANWVNFLIGCCPSVKFHLLGSTHKTIRNKCPRLFSLDSSTWILTAVNGYPKHIPGVSRENKLARAMWNLCNLMGDEKRGKELCS